MHETRLILSRGGFPPYSARECKQNLLPIETGALKRTVNGELISLSSFFHQKYRSVITCCDEKSPALEHLWPGEVVDVHCIQYLRQKSMEKTSSFSRPPRSDSICASLTTGEKIPWTHEEEHIVLHTPQPGPYYVSYQPILTMAIISFSMEHDEWGKENPWKIILEEV